MAYAFWPKKKTVALTAEKSIELMKETSVSMMLSASKVQENLQKVPPGKVPPQQLVQIAIQMFSEDQAKAEDELFAKHGTDADAMEKAVLKDFKDNKEVQKQKAVLEKDIQQHVAGLQAIIQRMAMGGRGPGPSMMPGGARGPRRPMGGMGAASPRTPPPPLDKFLACLEEIQTLRTQATIDSFKEVKAMGLQPGTRPFQEEHAKRILKADREGKDASFKKYGITSAKSYHAGIQAYATHPKYLAKRSALDKAFNDMYAKAGLQATR